jgi:hypothetical protein
LHVPYSHPHRRAERQARLAAEARADRAERTLGKDQTTAVRPLARAWGALGKGSGGPRFGLNATGRT